jgi:hypothetical protein
VVRSSRFAGVAVGEVRRRWPESDIRVVYQPGSEAEVQGWGLVPEASLCVGGRLRLLTFATSDACAILRAWKPDDVVFQWWREDGRGHEAADAVALALGQRQLQAVLEDGRWVTMSVRAVPQRWLRLQLRRLRGLALVALIAVACAASWPAYAWSRRRSS